MNLGERSSASPHKDKPSKDATAASKAFREEMMSPTRRSSRIRKIKIPYDNYNVEKSTACKGSKELPLDKSENPTTSTKINGLPDLEKNCQFFEIDGDDEESFESMFDDIFEQTYNKTLQSLLPKKLSDESIRERKFFKRNSLERTRVDLPNYVNETSLPAEDVTKVFKIISKPTVLSDIPIDTKTTGKSSLKTYSNKRKSFDRNNVVESFGLPDYPVVPEVTLKPLKPTLNDKLDADILDASEITILDLQYTNEPWVGANTNGQDVFPYYEDVRIKADPTEHDFFKNSSLLDVKDAEDCGIYANDINASLMTPKNSMTFEMSKDIDIEAIKINFKKMLSSPVKSTPKDTKRKTSPRKKNTTKPPGSGISFVENDSLTEDDTEFEFSNTVPAQSKSRRGRSSAPITSSSENKRKKSNVGRVSDVKSENSIRKNETMVKNTKTVVEKTESVVCNSGTVDVRKPGRSKKVLRSSLDYGMKCKEKYTAADVKDKIDDTDEVFNKLTNYQSETRRMLRSSSQERLVIRDKNILSENMVKKHSPSNEVLTRNADVEKTDNDTDEVFNKVTNYESETRRMLRSSSQERLVSRDKNILSENMVKKHSPSNEVLTGAKIAGQKCSLKTTDHVEKSNNCIEASKISTSFHGSDNSMLPDVILEKCSMNLNSLQNNLEKIMSPLRKHSKPLPEVRVVIRPLDITQLANKLTGNVGHLLKRDELLSPRKLRSNKNVEPDKETKQSPSKSIVKRLFENNPSQETDSTKSDDNIQRYRMPKKSVEGDSDEKITKIASVKESKTDITINLLDENRINLRKIDESVTINCNLNKSDLNRHKINDFSNNQDDVLKNVLKSNHILLNNEKAVCNDVLLNDLPLEYEKVSKSSTNSLVGKEEGILDSAPSKRTGEKVAVGISKTNLEKTLVKTDNSDTLHKIFDSDLHQRNIDNKATKENTTITKGRDQNDKVSSDDAITDVGNTSNASKIAKSKEICSENLYNKNKSTKRCLEFLEASGKVENTKNENKTSSNNTSRLIDTKDECITNISTGFLSENEKVNENAANDVETKNPVMRSRSKEGKINPDMPPRKLEKEKIFSPNLKQRNNEVKAFDSEKLEEISSDISKTNTTKHLSDEELKEISDIVETKKNKDKATLKTDSKLSKTYEECRGSLNDLENETEFVQIKSKRTNEVPGTLENAVSTVEETRRVSSRFKEGKNIPNMSPKNLFTPRFKKKSETKLEFEEIASDTEHSKKKSHVSEDSAMLNCDSGENSNLKTKEIVNNTGTNKNEGNVASNKSLTLSDTDTGWLNSNDLVLENEKKTDKVDIEHWNFVPSTSEHDEGRRRGRNRFKEGTSTDVSPRKVERERVFSPKLKQKNIKEVKEFESEKLDEISSETIKNNSHTTEHDSADEGVREINDKVEVKKNKDKTTIEKANKLTKIDEEYTSNRPNDLKLVKVESKQVNEIPVVSENTLSNVEEKRRVNSRFNERKSTVNISPRKLFSPRLKKKLEAKLELEEVSSDTDHPKNISHKSDNSMLDVDGGEKLNLEAKEIVDIVENSKNEDKIDSNRVQTLSDTNREFITTRFKILVSENEKILDNVDLEHLNSATTASENVEGRRRGRNSSKESKNTDTTPRNVEGEKMFSPKLSLKNSNTVKAFVPEKLDEISSETNKNNSVTTEHDSADEEVKKINDKVERKKNKNKTNLNEASKLLKSYEELIISKSNDLENAKKLSKVESKQANAVGGVEEKRRISSRFKECKSTPNMSPRKLFSPRLKKKLEAKMELEENSVDNDHSKKELNNAEDNSILNVDGGEKSNLQTKEVNNVDSNKSLTLFDTDRECTFKGTNVLNLENEKKLDKADLEHLNATSSASENIEGRRRGRNRSKEDQNTDISPRKVEREKKSSPKLKPQNNANVNTFELEKISSDNNKINSQPGEDNLGELSNNQVAEETNKTVENNKNEDQSILIKPSKIPDVDKACRSNDLLPENDIAGISSKQFTKAPNVSENIISNVEDRRRGRNKSKEGKSKPDMTLKRIEKEEMFSPRSKQKNNEAKSHELETVTDSTVPENKKGKSTIIQDIESTHDEKLHLSTKKIVDKVKDNKNEDKASTVKSSKSPKTNKEYTDQKSTNLLLQNDPKCCEKKSKQSVLENSASTTEDKPKVRNRSKEGNKNKNKVETYKDKVFSPNLKQNCSSEGKSPDLDDSQEIASDNITNRKKSNQTILGKKGNSEEILNNVESTNEEKIIVKKSKVLPAAVKECSSNKITPKGNAETSHADGTTEGNTVPEQSTRKVEKFNSRLKQKRLKLIGSKPNGLIVEKSLKIPTQGAAAVEVANVVEESILDPTIPVNEIQKRASRKTEHIQTINDPSSKRVSRRSAHNQTDSGDNVKASRRMSRRQSADDSKLLNKNEEEYSGRLRRCKSVAPRALYLKKFADDSELTNESSGYCGRLRSKSVAPSTRTKTSDEEVDSRVTRKSRDKVTSEENKDVEAYTLKRRKSFRHVKRSEDLAESEKGTVKCDRRFKEYRDKIRAEAEQKLANMEESKDFKDIKLEHDVDFQIGDIAWGQIGSHPFWPCLVMEEPGTGYHKKIFQGKRFQRVLYHVRFFGDKGRRAWINKHQIMLYCTQNDLKILIDKLKNESKVPPLQSYYVRSDKLAKWENAVAEAEHVKLKKVNQRLDLFFEMVASQNAKKDEVVIEDNLSEKSEPVSVKRKHKDVQDSDEKLEMSPSRKKFKKDINESEEKDDAVDATQQSVDETATQNEKMLTRLRLRTPMDEISEIDSKTSSDNTMDTSLDLMAAQKALFKRNNLFKGISRDKVCQHCYKPGDVLKCRGRCNGVYHVDCATKILQEQIFKKRRGKVPKSSPKQCKDSVDADDDTNHLDDDTTKNNDLLDEDHVQIITVPSSVYNTPPRKTFPPNFRNMTLAEQIDYKMKEIMRKFESKTFYSETTIETNAEDSNVHMTPKHIPMCDTPYPNVDKVPKKIENIAKPENQSLIRQFQQDVKQKLFMQHVTADSEAVKCDIPDVGEKQLNGEKTTDVKPKVDPKKFKCGFCITNLDPFCFICCQSISKKGNAIRQKCSLYQCGRFYHPECLKMWPQTQWSLIQTTKHKDSNKVVDSFVCPLHVCHTCASDDPRAATSRCSGDKIVKCLRCPSTYHSTNLCVPAGSTILSSTQIICPRHREKSKQYTINTTWCFLCSQGGNLICCETCPTSVHPECLPVNLTEDDKFICEDCESGRLPLYDEIVWVKLGKFRWWPALILFPNEIPDNIMNIRHGTGEFVVKFFGTYDHYWVNRGRSFLFQDGDTGHCNSVKKKVDAAFNTAVEEAVVAHKLKKEFKLSQEAESITSLKPPPYIRIKVNKPVGNVRQLDLDLSSTNACECDPSQPHPCGPDSDCLNRLLLTECSADVCPAGNRCKNQSFEKREYPPMVPYKTQGRGWGLKTLAPIKKGQFVVEYVGEMIDIEEYQRRIQKMHEQKEENYYFLTIDKDRMLDAGPKGNMARFMNHCCQPNCETQKWTVNGDTRVGLFATEDIPADTELTFNYNLECVGKEKKVCRCGAPNCSGFIGVKAKQDTDPKKPKKSYKKKVAIEPIILPPCFMCGKKGDVVACNNKICNKAYHLKCLELVELPEGNKFVCPWHNCNICSKRTIRCCVKCVNSFCPSHSESNVRYDNLLGFVCNTHDPMRASSNDLEVKLKKRRSNTITDETAVTSTTSDDVDDEEDAMPLLLRHRLQSERDASITFDVNQSSTPLKKFKTFDDVDTIPLLWRSKMRKSKNYQDLDTESESETDCNQSATSASLKRLDCSRYDSQDESTVSSATLTDFEEESISKRKRGRSRRVRSEKKAKLSVQNKSTANNSSLRDVDSLRSNSNSELDSRHNELENR